MHKQQGLSLIELMISITLGIVLMTGVMQMFLSSRTVFATQQGMSRIQESGRLAMEFLSRDIRMAGYSGCMSRTNPEFTNTLKTSTDFKYRMSVGIEGYTHATGAAPGSTLNPVPIAGTDILVVRSASGNGATIEKTNDAAQLFITNTGVVAGACGSTASYSGICDGDILVVSDCVKARIFQATSVNEASGEINVKHASSGTPGNDLTSWGGAKADPAFDAGSDILTFNHIVYYIGTSPTTSQPTLYQSINGKASLELLEGVENMNLTYSRESTPATYQSAAALPAGIWEATANRVVSVRIQLLVRSTEDNVLAESQPYIFPEGAAAATPADRRMRQVFTSTVGIRSRLP